ncbi:MAG: hypothetical protein ACE5IJ_03260 [Thermoplasmata archaeon]
MDYRTEGQGVFMESQARLSAVGEARRWLTFTVLGFLGLVLGMFVPFAAGIGVLLLSAGALLWFTALFGRKDTAWSSEVNYYGVTCRLRGYGGPGIWAGHLDSDPFVNYILGSIILT